MDGVLVNFNKGCQNIFDWPRKPQKPGEDLRKFLGLSNKEFWNTIDSYGEEWWSNLEPEPWHKELINLVSSYDPNFIILTSPSCSHYAASGKMLWLQKYFNDKYFNRFIITPAKNKYLLANDSILIDDNEKNCEEFSMRGKPILFPRAWNTYCDLEINKLHYVESQLFNYNLNRNKIC